MSQECRERFPRLCGNLQHRISATGCLLFVRCVSFTFIGLLPTWTPTEIFDSFWDKHFQIVTEFVKFRKRLGISKQTEYFVFLIAVVAAMLSVTLAPRAPVVDFLSLTT